jgi:hypothetical protein
LDRSISYPHIELRRRIGLPLDSLCGQDLVPARLYSDSLSSSATSRQGLGHFGNLRKPPPPTPGSVLSTLLRQYRAGRSLHVSPRVVAPLAGPGDNSSTHQGTPLQQLLRQHSRLHIEHVASYPPELNPDEGVWSLAKRALANSCPNDVEELVEDVIDSINGIRMSTQKLRGCILQSGLHSFLP